MRLGGLIALTSGFLAVAAHAQADSPRATYVTLVLQAFAAKVACPGTDVAYQDLLQKAQEMKLPDGTTERVELTATNTDPPPAGSFLISSRAVLSCAMASRFAERSAACFAALSHICAAREVRAASERCCAR